ncbi:hypothetical protein [Dietzia cinnamea]|uniref:hypothetical protein n=1 Tax=Dietzia cinnamea TaxID=321318 RepID=UPI00223A8085|nr:hypothetical protein [Dietzia cinnamea]MCT2060757.1 hypothetical protein [Dietzia cinnamea]MCT2237223.1 hypothetical protein [Dietzia cinnamea]MCT2301905.1 hypothetical protein [Dietzia cinnamea]
MFQRRSHRTAPRSRTLALGGALAALAVVGGGTVVAVTDPTAVDAGDIQLTQNAADQAAAQEMPLGAPVNLDLEPVVARAAGGTIPDGTTIQVTGLPDGLVQDGWVISGTPTRAGEYEVLVTVSNGALSQSQKVAITVVDGAGAARQAATTDGAGADAEGETGPSTTEPSTTDEPSTTVEPSTTSEPTTADGSTTDDAQPDPTLSAAPGDPNLADGTAGDENEAGDDGEAGTGPDLCSVVGDGEMDGASLAQLLPLVTGDQGGASSGLVLMLVNAVVGLLPSVLGDSGSLGGIGSAGELLCTISPALLGGQSAGAAGDDATPAGAAATTGAGGLAADPTALLGLLTTGAGSLGQ